MDNQTVKIGFPVQFPRYVSPRAIVDFAKMLEASGVVDDLLTYDYLVSLLPRSLWTPDVTPGAEIAPDDDSYHDAFVLAAMAASASDLGICIMSDAMRRGPWFVQTMLSLAGATPGQVTLAMGAGEARHAAPFGYARNEGLGRLRDLLKVWKLLVGATGPVDFEGKYWKLQQTYVGAIQPAKPKIYALGGGPLLIKSAIRDADGLMTYAPGAFTSPEHCAEQVATIKKGLAENGRDPDSFDIALTVGTLVSDDEEQTKRVMENKLVRFYCAIFGRLAMADWEKEGFEPPFPLDWHYAQDLFPVSMTREAAEAAVSRVSPEMVRKSLIVGSTTEVAAKLQEYVDAGVTWIAPADVGAFAGGDQQALLSGMLEVCGILKGKRAS